MTSNYLPNFETLAHLIRDRRKALKLSQADAAALSGVGTRFFSELENAKATVQIGKVLQVMRALGLSFEAKVRGES